MPINNDEELAGVVSDVGEKLQQIQDYLGQNPSGENKIRFPRGFIRTADHFRNKLFFIENRDVRDNLAYALILSDVYRWITNRTDLYGIAREMIIKAGIVLSGSIAETIMVEYTKGRIGRRHGVAARCDRMAEAGMLSGRLSEELKWLWEIRGGIHIYEVGEREYERYSMADYNRAIYALRNLREELEVDHLGF
ncbi:MAG: hypothetical protein ACJAWP_000006 [Porticoccus sp.]|uniref:hypothetical protein n=1 Tax=Porticoccus sp. TaxID=2024853 RepID=UPI0039E2A25F